MLLEQETRVVAREGVLETAKATIKATPKIFNFFADQTYANKPKAICRELVANAVDSHVMAGHPELPVEVWLPTLLDPTFRVRDRGLGMSHEFMMTSFMAYTDGSTKDQSNIAIGGFGIGSKSPFAYTDQYTIVSRFDGVESVYSVFKDEDGIPSIALLGQRPSTEDNGVEVSFPVAPEDFTTFESAAFEALRYFDPLPVILNAVNGAFTPPDYIATGETWAMRPQAGDLAVIMGGIRYPVTASSLNHKFAYDSPARKLLTYGLDIKVPIGACSVALSRESLSYDDRTIAALQTVCESVVEEVAASFATMFDYMDSEWEVRCALYKEVGDVGYGRGPRAEFLLEHAKWRGAPIDMTKDAPRLGYSSWTIRRDLDRRSRRSHKAKPIGSAKWEALKSFVPGRVETLLIDDLPQVSKSKTIRKIKDFCDNSAMCGDVLVIRPHDDSLTPQALIDAFGAPPEDTVVLASSLPEPIVERTIRSGYGLAVRPRVRMFRYDGSHAQTSINPGRWGRAGVREIDYADQPDTGILVTMEQFQLPADLYQIMSSGLLSWHELQFVNSGDAKKLRKANFVDWRTEFERRKKAKLAETPDLAIRLALDTNSALRWLFTFFDINDHLPQLSPRTPLGKIQQLYHQYVQPLTGEQRMLRPFVEPKLPARIKPEELRDQFRSKQWKAARLIGALPNFLDEEDTKLFLENL